MRQDEARAAASTLTDVDVDGRRAVLVERLRGAGAKFAFLHGSRVGGRAGVASDLDVAAWWGTRPPSPWDVELPDDVDLLVLDTAPLELAGRVALDGVLLLDDDAPARVRWVATTRKVYLDERPRLEAARDDFLRARSGG